MDAVTFGETYRGKTMDALTFIRETNRMCKSFGDSCEDCPANDVTGCMVSDLYEEIVSIVEKWSKENPPRKTRQDAFLKERPNAELSDDNVLMVCPIVFDRDFACPFENDNYMTCSDCRRKFWMQEVE